MREVLVSLTIKWQDVEGLKRFDNALKALGDKEMRKVTNRAVNRAGDMARTKVRRELARQTGLKYKVIKHALKTKRSSWSTLEYRITARGGDIALKYFSPRETSKGVTAAPFGKRKLFPGTFMKAGWWPNRVVNPSWNGHVFKRVGNEKSPIEKEVSGVSIPNEMVQGASKDVFQSTVARVLPQRIEHEIKRLTKGVVS